MWAIDGIVTPVLAAGQSKITGYQTTFNNQQHVIFVGSDNHIHELVYKDHWYDTDLTQSAGAPNAAPGSALDGYETSFNSQQHVNHIGTDGHVHELNPVQFERFGFWSRVPHL